MKRKVGLAVIAAGLLLAGVAFVTRSAPVNQAMGDPSGVSESDPQAIAVAAADKAAASGLDALRHGSHEQLDRRAVYKGAESLYYVSYERTYRGLPVVGGDMVVATNTSGKVLSTVAASNADIKVGIAPSVSADKATVAAKALLEKVGEATAPKLVVLATGQPQPILAWHVTVSGAAKGKASRQNVYVDAVNGKVALSQEEIHAGTGTGIWSGANLTIPTSGSAGNYQMRDTTRGNISCNNYSGSAGAVFTDADNVWGSTSKTDKVSGCVDVMYATAAQWDMVNSWLGRNGLNGSGGGWTSYVGLTDTNAYWNYVPNATLYGYNPANQWLTAIDVVAHENGHGIDQNTPGGSASEAGLGESTGDIFAAMTEHYINSSVDTPDYLVGERVNFNGNGTPLRNMYNPSSDGRSPNCYSASIPSTETHDAAGPMNHWFYLLAEGNNPGGGKPASTSCTGGPTGLVGVGIQTAGKIFYNAMLLKTSSMTYKKYRIATLQAAKNLDTTCGLFNKTKAAWDAVTLPAQPGETTCVPTGGGDWSMSLNPASRTIAPGASGQSTVSTATTSGTAQNVTFSATGQPAGVTVSFSPATVSTGNSSTMTVNVGSSVATGPYQITVNGDGTTDHSVTFSLNVGTGPTTPGVPDIDIAKVQAHLTQFNTIATSNGGNRRAGSAGYTASLTYLRQKLEAAGYTVTLQRCNSGCTYQSDNLIADWPGGPANQVVMFGAHLDSVAAGPGINDNASGSSALLESALALAAANPTMSKHVRFGWWTDEEQGLNGSRFYVNSLTATQRSQIQAYYNFDMVGSRNGGYFINNINSAAAAPLREFWTSKTLSPEENTEGAGRSDDASFQNGGIATSGYASGASSLKTAAQAQKWGGTANAAYDACYHQACDTTTNINATVLNNSADGIAYAIWKTSVSAPTNDFSVSVSPTSGNANKGSSTTATVSTSTTAGSAQTVTLSASGQPSGVTVSFSPASVTSGGNSTMTVAASASSVSGDYNITITGTGTGASAPVHTTTYAFRVNGGTGTPPPTTPPSGRTFTNGTDYQILDNQIFSNITSNASGSAVSPVRLSITINHTCALDLGISLVAPNGAIYPVLYSGTGNYICTPFGGTRIFNVPVSSAAAGTWRLRVTDYGPGDYGVLDTWSITL